MHFKVLNSKRNHIHRCWQPYFYSHSFPFSQCPTRHICPCTMHCTGNQLPPPALSHAKLAIPKKGLRTPARLPTKPRRLQKSNSDPGSAVKVTPTCKLPWGSPLPASILAHSIKSLMVQNDAVPTEFGGVGLFGFGFILFHDFVSHCPYSSRQPQSFEHDLKRWVRDMDEYVAKAGGSVAISHDLRCHTRWQ